MARPPTETLIGPSERRHWQRRLARRIQATDAFALAVAIGAAHVVRYVLAPTGTSAAGQPYLVGASVGLFLCWVIALNAGHTRDPKILDSVASQHQAVVRASFHMFASVAIVALVFRLPLSREFIAMAGIGGLVSLLASRRLWGAWVVRQRGRGALMANALVIGGVDSAKAITQRFATDPGYGLRVTGVWVPDRPAARHESFRAGDTRIPVLGTESGLDAALATHSVERVTMVVVTDTEHLGHDGMRELAWALEGRDVDLLVAPNVIDVAGPRVHVEAHGNMPLIYLSGPQYTRARSLSKTLFDRVFAVVVLVAAAPILLLAMCAIRLTGKGPIFYRSERIGAHGIPFQMYKLRTMKRGADQVREELVKHNLDDGPLFKLRDDPRVTAVGRFLRRYSIDEIPQFVNVLSGDMSVVGPRPPLQVEVDSYDATIRRRLLVKQGITGLWQISGRSDLSWEDSVRLDLDYVENWSMMRDLQIISRTLRAVIASRGAY